VKTRSHFCRSKTAEWQME